MRFWLALRVRQRFQIARSTAMSTMTPISTQREVSDSSGTSEPILMSGPTHQINSETTSSASSMKSSGLKSQPRSFFIA